MSEHATETIKLANQIVIIVATVVLKYVIESKVFEWHLVPAINVSVCGSTKWTNLSLVWAI